MRNDRPARGYIIRLFGVVLIFVGALDSMLSWRGGFAVGDFYLFLIASGFVLYGVGSVRRRDRT